MLMTAMSGAKHTFGFRGQRASWLLNNRAPAPDRLLKRDTVHSVEQQLALLNFAGVPIPQQPQLSLSIDPGASARARAKLIAAGLTAATLTSERFAIVAAGAAFESKRWGTRGFAAVMDHLYTRWQLQSVIIAGPGQERLAVEVARLSNSNPHVLCEISLAELKAVVGDFGRVFVGNDSGPMHIAAALGCPVVAVFGSSNPDVWHPWTSAAYKVIGGERGTPDSNVRGSISGVEANQVIAAVDEVLEVSATRAAS
jgi:ADP-heptose:LPS heptosyltransferase